LLSDKKITLMKNLLYIIALILLLISCKKEETKSIMVVNINAINPVTNTPFKGVKYQILEVETIGKGLFYTTYTEEKKTIHTGETNANGKVNIEFEIFKTKFDYEIQFDFEHMDVPEGDYELNKGGHFSILYKNEDNNFDFELLPYFSYIKNIQNIDCFDENDKMRMRQKYIYTGSGNWTKWGETYNDYSHGCVNKSYPLQKPQDLYIYEIETTKNGIVTTYIDTFIPTNNIDTFKVYY